MHSATSDTRVSVVIPAYNAASTIGDTLKSVLAQSHSDLEIIVVDDGSTDATAQVVASHGDERIRYIFQHNQERSVARNTGISHASGAYVAFVDADDIWLPDKLVKQLALMRSRAELGLVYCDAYQFDAATGKDLFRLGERTKLHRGYVWQELLLEGPFIQSPTPLVRRQVFECVGGFDPHLSAGEDWDMWLRIAAKYPVDYVDEALVRYRWHPHMTNWTNRPDALYAASLRVLRKARQQEPARYRKAGLRAARRLAHIHYSYGVSLQRRGSYLGAIQAYTRSLATCPAYCYAYARMVQCLAMLVVCRKR